MTLAALSRATSLHVNTLRGHLAELEAHGRVRRHRATPVGRGRPAWLYEATVPPDTTSVVGYADLAAALADVINRHSPDPRADGIAAGEEWGPRAKGRESWNESGNAATRDRMIRLLADLGFAPESLPGENALRLTHCPVLDVARSHPDVVCGVHLGIIRGALQDWGIPSQEVELLPFSEPGACRLLFLARAGPPSRP